MPDKKLFVLNAEMGECDAGYYFKMVFDDGTEFRNETRYITDAISSSVYRLDKAHLLERMVSGDIKSKPIQITPTHPSLPKLKPGQLLTPKDLGSITKPADCQPICTSFDFFGQGKCKNMCPQKFGL